jgi:hypothetical protein
VGREAQPLSLVDERVVQRGKVFESGEQRRRQPATRNREIGRDRGRHFLGHALVIAGSSYLIGPQLGAAAEARSSRRWPTAISKSRVTPSRITLGLAVAYHSSTDVPTVRTPRERLDPYRVPGGLPVAVAEVGQIDVAA